MKAGSKRSADIPVREKERGLSSPLHGGLENPPSGTDKALKEILGKLGL